MSSQQTEFARAFILSFRPMQNICNYIINLTACNFSLLVRRTSLAILDTYVFCQQAGQACKWAKIAVNYSGYMTVSLDIRYINVSDQSSNLKVLLRSMERHRYSLRNSASYMNNFQTYIHHTMDGTLSLSFHV